MTKTASLTYSPDMVVPAGTVLTIDLHLIDSDGNIAQGYFVAPGIASISIEVGPGTGWKVRATSRLGNSSLGVAESAPFDVVDTQVVKIVTAVVVS